MRSRILNSPICRVVLESSVPEPWALTVRPAGDIENSIAFYLVEEFRNPIVEATPPSTSQAIVIPWQLRSAEGTVLSGRNISILPIPYGDNLEFTFNLGAGTSLNRPSLNLATIVEWGPDFTASDHLRSNVASPDFNGDLMVNLAGLGNFGQIHSSPAYEYRADFNNGAAIDLVDLGVCGQHYMICTPAISVSG